jgi:hypothetical protein
MFEFHVRGLLLTLRIPLGFLSEDEAQTKLFTAVPAVVNAADLIWRSIGLPGSGHDPAAISESWMFVPPEYHEHQSSAPLLPLLLKRDKEMQRWITVRQQHGSQLQREGQTQWEPSGDTREAWARAALATAEGLHFLFQVADVLKAHDTERREHNSQQQVHAHLMLETHWHHSLSLMERPQSSPPCIPGQTDPISHMPCLPS